MLLSKGREKQGAELVNNLITTSKSQPTPTIAHRHTARPRETSLELPHDPKTVRLVSHKSRLVISVTSRSLIVSLFKVEL